MTRKDLLSRRLNGAHPVLLALALALAGLIGFAESSHAQSGDTSATPTEAAVFTTADRDRALLFWNDGSRYQAGVPTDAATRGLYQVHLTVAGSCWLDAYQRLGTRNFGSPVAPDGTVPVSPGNLASLPSSSRPGGNTASRAGKRGQRSPGTGQPGPGQPGTGQTGTGQSTTPQTTPNQAPTGVPVPPTANPVGPNPVWDAWIAAKIASDRYNAKVLADSENVALGLKATYNSASLKPAPSPGPCPADLVAAAGDPPCFAESSAATEYRVQFDDCSFSLRDHVSCSEKYRFYRSEKGVDFEGTSVISLGPDRLTHLAHMAGVDQTAMHVLAAVSGLEGGFDALNTYDTGFVSAGFIQFATLREGGGSLGGMLLSYKTSNPTAFDRDFRAFGIDVTPTGKMAVLDLETGVELHGPDANTRVIEDKRLTAVFARAGQRSDAFLAAQIATARDWFYPANDTVQVTLDGVPTTLKISDFIHSEAGLAVLTDLKVNRGNIRSFPPVLQAIADKHHAKNVTDLAACEREIMAAMKYRKDFSKDPTLSQPGQPKKPDDPPVQDLEGGN